MARNNVPTSFVLTTILVAVLAAVLVTLSPAYALSVKETLGHGIIAILALGVATLAAYRWCAKKSAF